MPDRKIKIILDASIAGFTAKMAAAEKAVADAANKMTGASKESAKFRRGLDELGGTAGKVGLVAAAGVGAIVVATANFEQSMSRVEAATHASVATMEELRKAAIIAGRDTVFSATESADAITAMSKAGVSAGDILKGGLSGALSLASAGELDVASAADIAATAMNQFGLAGKDIPHIADLLAAAAGKAQGEVTDMANSLKFVGPVAHQMGVSIEETTGTIAELASQGILGEQAGTSLRGMLTALTSPSQLASKEMKRLGISLYDATGNFVGFRGVAEQLHDTMANLSNAERDQALGRIFGNEQITAARILYAGGSADVDKWTKSVNDQGYAADTAAIKLDNLRGDLEQLRGSLETALIGSGSGSQGPLRGLVQGLTDATNQFNKLPGAAQNSLTGLLAITALTGGSLWFGSKVIKGIADTRGALDNLGLKSISVGRTMRSALAVGAIIEGFDLLDQGMDALFNKNLNESNLGRSLDALAKGEVAGEIKDKFGKDLEDFGAQALQATSHVNALNRAVKGVPLVGGILSGDILPHDTSTAVDNIHKLDDALAGMVESGNGEQAAAILEQLKTAAADAGVGSKDFTGLFKQYAVAVDNAGDAALSTSGAASLMSDAMTGLLAPTGQAADAVGALGAASAKAAEDQAAVAKALDASRKAAHAAAEGFVGIGKSFDKPKVGLDAWIDDMEKQAKALQNLLKNAKLAAKNGVAQGLIHELEEQGPAGALRLQQLANTTDKEVGRANKVWREGQRAIDDYTDAVGGVPAVDIETARAERKLKRLQKLMAGFHDIELAVNVKTGFPQGAKNRLERGDFYAGGYTGAGGKYEPAGVVHRREYVFSSEATQGNEQYLDSLHRSLRGYSGGGLVGGPTPAASPAFSGTVNLSAGDIAALAQAMAAIQPMYGPVSISPHNYSEFTRQLQQDRRAAGIGGPPA